MTAATMSDRNATGYAIHEASKYRHVAAILSNGQHTARWSQERATGTWYESKGWKIANRRKPLSASAGAFIEAAIVDAEVVR